MRTTKSVPKLGTSFWFYLQTLTVFTLFCVASISFIVFLSSKDFVIGALVALALLIVGLIKLIAYVSKSGFLVVNEKLTIRTFWRTFYVEDEFLFLSKDDILITRTTRGCTIVLLTGKVECVLDNDELAALENVKSIKE